MARYFCSDNFRSAFFISKLVRENQADEETFRNSFAFRVFIALVSISIVIQHTIDKITSRT